MLLYSQVDYKEVGTINRRIFILIVLLIVLIGTGGIISLSFSRVSNETFIDPQEYINNKPSFKSSIVAYGKQVLKMPMGAAVGNGLIYIIDSGNKRLAIVSKLGKLINWITLTSDIGENYPVGIAVDKKLQVYISTIGDKGKIVVYNEKAEYLYQFPQDLYDNPETDTPAKPVGLHISGKRLFVTDVQDQDIKVYDLSGKFLFKFGKPGNGKGEFLYPNAVTTDDNGYIYVSDSNNGRIQVFNEKGKFLFLFSGPKKDPLALPRGLVFDKKENLHVVDTLKHKVFIFNKRGYLINTYGSFGNQESSFSYPNSISIDPETGELFIADKQNNRISIWK